MKKLIPLLLILVACGADPTENTDDSSPNSTFSRPVSDLGALGENEFDEDLDAVEEKQPFVPIIDDNSYCLPYPNARYQRARAGDSLWSLPGSEYESVYIYLYNHIDSTGKKVITKTDSIFGPTEWYQRFELGIKYENYYYPEKGSGGRLLTRCKDAHEFRYLMSAILALGADRNEWNEDSTSYSPDGAGCYYDVLEEKNGSFSLDWYCGC